MGFLSGFKKKKSNSKSNHGAEKMRASSHSKSSIRKKGRTSSMTTTATSNDSTFASSAMDVPVNVNVEKRDRRSARGFALRKTASHFSTFSLLSMPSFNRGISQHLENPHLWDYDRGVYNDYDINEEIDNIKEPITEENSTCNSNSNEDEQDEDPFFAANPLPKTNLSSSSATTVQEQQQFASPMDQTPTFPKNPSRSVQFAAAPTASSSNLEQDSSAKPSVTDMPAGDPTLATPAKTRDLVKKFISEIWNMGDPSIITEVCSPTICCNGHNKDGALTNMGHEGLAETVRGMHKILDGLFCEIHSMVVEGNKAFCRLCFTGFHTGDRFMGYEPTGRRVSWMAASEFTCVDGVILKVWELADVTTLKAKLKENSAQNMQPECNQEESYDTGIVMTNTHIHH